MAENSGAPGVESLVKRGYLFLEDSDWAKADEYFDKALDIDPEHAPAYIGKLCAELQVRREESLGNYQELRQGKKIDKPLGGYAHFQKALRFADDNYLNKLNAYAQKIKERLPKTIPQEFTDEYINGEMARLEKEIADCDTAIAGEKRSVAYWDSEAAEALNEMSKVEDYYRSCYPDVVSYPNSLIWKMAAEDAIYKSKKEHRSFCYGKSSECAQRVRDYTAKKAKCEAKKKEIEPFVGLSWLDRMGIYYNRFVTAMKKGGLTEDEYREIAKQFRTLAGYEDSNQLADQCDKLADEWEENQKKEHYDSLVQKKNSASTEYTFIELANAFRSMGGYKDTAQLAIECDKAAIKAEYARLVQEKSKASTENEYNDLARQFRGMNGYENSTNLAKECEDQYSVLKKQREEREQKEKEESDRREEQARSNRYDGLIQLMNRTSTETEYQKLAQLFREMNGYKNTAELASVCDEKYNALKKSREDEERRHQKFENSKPIYGLLIQFGIMVASLCVLWGTKYNGVMMLIIPGLISLVFGLISLLFRREVYPKFPWGIIFLVFGLVVTTVSASVWEGCGIISSIILTLLVAIPASLLYRTYGYGWKIAFAIAVLIIGGVTSAVGNYSIFIFSLLAIFTIPGIIIMCKVEGWEPE